MAYFFINDAKGRAVLLTKRHKPHFLRTSLILLGKADRHRSRRMKLYCIVSQIGGIHKGQVQLNTLISTTAKREKTIKKNFSFYSIILFALRAS